jgi:hypothetical protein
MIRFLLSTLPFALYSLQTLYLLLHHKGQFILQLRIHNYMSHKIWLLYRQFYIKFFLQKTKHHLRRRMEDNCFKYPNLVFIFIVIQVLRSLDHHQKLAW